MIPLFVCFIVVSALTVFLGVLCYVLGRENERLCHRAWSRVKTSIRLRRLRRLHRDFEEYVNGEDEGRLAEFADQNWRMQ